MAGPEPRRFATTRWTLVVRAGGTSDDARSALADLCGLYWHPVYAFVRRTGCSPDDAGDVTQAFFTQLLAKNWVRGAQPERGRFRSFLIASLKHFMSNQRDSSRALKRGGGRVHLPLEVQDEGIPALQLSDDLTPERVYEHRWAMTVLDEARARLAARYDRAGNRALFLRLQPMLMNPASCTHAVLAGELGMSEGAVRVAMHRLRKEFGAALRATVAQTVASPEDVDDELRYLLAVLGRRD